MQACAAAPSPADTCVAQQLLRSQVRLDPNGDAIPSSFKLFNYVRETLLDNSATNTVPSSNTTYRMQKNAIGTCTTDTASFQRTAAPIVFPGEARETPLSEGASKAFCDSG